uniref:PASTA domain-containing protein n=1 Tax=Alistipes sp. TaxID=1872444 RepID=UPI004055F882
MNPKINQWVERLKQYPLLYTLLRIALVLLIMAISAHLLMLVATRHGARRMVPALTGISLSEAERLAEENDLELIVNDSLFVPIYEGGIVLDQLPEAEVTVKPGRKVYITINAFSHKMVEIPYVAGRSLRQAKNMLEIAGLEVDRLVYRPDMATNYVLEERYRGELIRSGSQKMAEAGSGVTLYVGMSEEESTAIVPMVVGESLREAKSRLWESGFNLGEVHYEEEVDLLTRKDARIVAQQPAPGTPLTLGREITLRLSLDEEQVAARRTEAEKVAREAAKLRQEEEERADSLEHLSLEEMLQGDAPVSAPEASQAAEDEFFD